MSLWPADELARISGSDDLHVSRFRDDGKTYGTPTWIRSVAVDGALYNGPNSRWRKAALQQGAGRIVAAGMTREVAFEFVEDAINDRIDGAYRVKYRDSPYLAPMIGPRAHAATVRIAPRG
jgi:hypothetical protein